MKRTFIQTKEFSGNWDVLGSNDNDLRRLELSILRNPEAGAVMSGTGGLRKIRFAFENRGKSGSVRVCFVNLGKYETVYLIAVFSKKEQVNLTRAQRNDIKKIIEYLIEELEKRS
jgi:hypothetical protein